MRYDKRTAAEVLASAELVNTEPTVDGGVRLVPHDKSPNPNWREAERDGDATGWRASRPPTSLGDAIYVTQPGDRPNGPGDPAAGVPLEETYPPRRDTLARQTADPSPPGAAWTAEGEILPGAGPWAYASAGRPKPAPPEAWAVPRGERGFASAVYGTAYGLADEDKNMTPPSAYAFTDDPVAEGQNLRQPLPDVAGSGAAYLYVAVTAPNRGEATGRVHEWVDLRKAVPPFVDVRGPYREDGRKPPEENRTGVGTLPAPAVGRGRPASRSRAWVEEERGPDAWGIVAARYRFYLIVRTDRGPSLWGEASREIVVEGDVEERRLRLADGEEPRAGETLRTEDGVRYAVSERRTGTKKGKVFRFRPPRNLPEDWAYGVGVQMIPPNGQPAFYRAGPVGGGQDYFFGGERGRGEAEGGVRVWGYTDESGPAGLQLRLISAEKPDRDDPEADGTAVTPPDPSSAPDAPYATGVPQPKPGSYKAATAQAVAGHPSEGPISNPTGKVRVASNQTLRVRPAPRLGVVPNAEGAERGRGGGILGWTSGGLSHPVSETVEDGVFAYSTATTIAREAFWQRTGPKWELTQGAETVMSIVGTLRVSGDTNGASEAVLVEYGEDGNGNPVEIGERPLVNRKGQALHLADRGTRTLLPRGALFGPSSSGGATAYTPGTTAVAWRFRAAPSSGGVDQTQWNQSASFEGFQIFPFAEPLRKTEQAPPPADDGSPPADADNVSAASPYPAQTTFALGPAPRVAGTPDEGPEPLEVVSFSSGSWPADWIAAASSGGGSDSIQTAADGTRSWLVSDASQGNVTQRGRSKVYPAASLDGRLAVRFLIDLEDLPQRGELRSGGVLDGQGRFIALFRLTPTALRLYRCRADGTIVEGVTVLGSLRDGGLLDVEIAVVGNTKDGVVRCSAGLDGPRSATKAFTGLDLSGRTPREASAVVRETDPAAKWRLRYRDDAIVVTRGGDVLDRENPASGPADVPPDPDAPPLAGVPGGFRLTDALDAKINQWWGVIEPGLGFGGGLGYRTLAPIVVVPGGTYTHALQWRHLLLDPAGTEDPVHQFFVTLKGEGVPDLHVGSPFGPGPDAGAASRVAGPRSGADASPPSGLAPSSEWAAEDFWHAFTVPGGYTEAHVGPRNDAPAIMVPQEHLFSPGALTTQTARDAMRAYGGEEAGTVAFTLDSGVPENELTPPALLAQRWVSFGASHGGGGFPELAWTAASSEDGEAWSEETADPLAVPERRILRVSFPLSRAGGSPGEAPEVPPGSVYLETRPLAEPVLLDGNRRHFPGAVVAGDAEAFAFSEEDEEPVDGHASSVRLSDDVERLPPMYLLGFTAAAERALRSVTARTVLYHEDPFGGPDGLGRVRRIRFYGRLDVESARSGPRRWAGSRRARVLVSATPEAEVLESAAMGPALFPPGARPGAGP